MFLLLLSAVLAAPPPPPADYGAWTLSHESSPDGRFDYTTARLKASQPVKGWPDKRATPELVIECQRRKIYLWVYTKLRPDAPGDMYDAWAALGAVQLDDAPWEKLKMRRSITEDGMYFPKTKAWLPRVRQAQTLGFAFTPFASPAVQTSFDLSEIERVLGPVERSCGKKR